MERSEIRGQHWWRDTPRIPLRFMRATALTTFSAHSRLSGNPALGPRFRGDERRQKPNHDKSRLRCYESLMLLIETEREDDGRWLAEVPALPGVMSYGTTDVEARAKATALGLRVVAERLEHGEALPGELSGMFQTVGWVSAEGA
jgi:predicted RNase H-like HicB family nuclease